MSAVKKTPEHLTIAPRLGTLAQAEARFVNPLGNPYLRGGHPLINRLEDKLNRIEGGKAAVCLGSGQAANDLVFAALLYPGDLIVSSRHIFGGTFALLKNYESKGIKVLWADPTDAKSFERVLKGANGKKARLLYAESVSNPDGLIADIAGLAAVAKRHKIPLVIDNTLGLTLSRPIAHGADIITSSLTKIASGHNDVVGGVVIDGGNFRHWNDARFSYLATRPGKNCKSIAEEFGPKAFAIAIRKQMVLHGPTMGLADAVKIDRHLSSAKSRAHKQAENARAVARYLTKHPAIAALRFPGFDGMTANTARMNRYFPGGGGSTLLVTLKGGRPALARCIKKLKHFAHRANIGQAESLVIAPSITTHRQFGPEEKAAAGISDGTLRVSIGVEPVKVLLADLEQALK